MSKVEVKAQRCGSGYSLAGPMETQMARVGSSCAIIRSDRFTQSFFQVRHDSRGTLTQWQTDYSVSRDAANENPFCFETPVYDVYVNNVNRGTVPIPCGASNVEIIAILRDAALANPDRDTIYFNSTCINLCNSSYNACIAGTCQTVQGAGANECTTAGQPCNTSSSQTPYILVAGLLGIFVITRMMRKK